MRRGELRYMLPRTATELPFYGAVCLVCYLGDKENYVCWMPQHHHHMWHAFNHHSSRRLSGMSGEAREKKEKPLWIGEGIWEDLCRQWRAIGYKEKCAQAKRNRAAHNGACVHTGGSISTGTHKQKLTLTLGREPTIDELFRHTHVKKANRSEWVSEKAQQTYENFKAKRQEIEDSCECSNEEGATNSKPSVEQIWIETVGGTKKGRLYGFGSKSSIYEHGNSSRVPPYSQSTPHMINELQEEMRKLQNEKKAMEEQFEERLTQQSVEINQEWEQRFCEISKQQQKMQEDFGKIMSLVRSTSKKKKRKAKDQLCGSNDRSSSGDTSSEDH